MSRSLPIFSILISFNACGPEPEPYANCQATSELTSFHEQAQDAIGRATAPALHGEMDQCDPEMGCPGSGDYSKWSIAEKKEAGVEPSGTQPSSAITCSVITCSGVVGGHNLTHVIETYPDASRYVTCVADGVGAIATYRYGQTGYPGGVCTAPAGATYWQFSLTAGQEFSLATLYGVGEGLIACMAQ